MSDRNGDHHAGNGWYDPTPFELIVSWLPYLSDAERGRLRAMLVRGDMIRREGVTPKQKELPS